MDIIGRLMFRSAAFVLDRLPVGMRHFVADTGALIDYVSSPGKRRNVRRNLAGIGAAADASSVFGIFRHHAANMVEIFASSRWGADEIRSRIPDAELGAVDRALERKRGVILVTVHTGNWELAALFLSRAGYRMHVVAGVQMNRLLTNAVKDAKHRFGIEVINPEHSYRKLFGALAGNGVVALLLDGDVYTGGAPVQLFGRRIVMPRGAVQLSERTGAPILGGYCRRLGREHYRIHLEKILDPEIAGRLGEEESMRLLYNRIEEFIARNSDQWCMFRDFWGDQQ
jgi:lauroyl/myristoyl acyltransferase